MRTQLKQVTSGVEVLTGDFMESMATRHDGRVFVLLNGVCFLTDGKTSGQDQLWLRLANIRPYVVLPAKVTVRLAEVTTGMTARKDGHFNY